MRHALGNIDAERSEKILEHRDRPPVAWSSVVDDNPEIVDAITHMKDSEIVNDTAKAAKKCAKPVAPAKSVAPTSSSSTSGGRPGAQAASWQAWSSGREADPRSAESASRQPPLVAGAGFRASATGESRQ